MPSAKRRPLLEVASLFAATGALAFGSPSGAEIVVSAGNQRASAADVERRLLAIPDFQLRSFGDSKEQVRKNVVERVIVRELLLDAEVERRKLPSDPVLTSRRREILRAALEGQLREELEKRPASAEGLRKEYRAQHARFNTPRKIRIWRIVVEDAALARKIIEEAKAAETVSRWSALAREHSLDKATHLRDGDLGFVRSDGSTDVPSLRVNPKLFEVADTVRDGELVPAPLEENGRYSVVWRRGSVPAVTRSFEQAKPEIERTLMRAKLAERYEALASRLEREHVKEVHPELLEHVNAPAFAETRERARPAIVPRQPKTTAVPKAR